MMAGKKRAFELDVIRGLSIFMMILHHLIWDLQGLFGYNYLFGVSLTTFMNGAFFNYFLQPFFLSCFILVSGICCTFSRNNLARSFRMLIGSIVISGVMAAVSFALYYSQVISDLETDGLFVFFNILHLLTVGTFVCWLIEKIERRGQSSDPVPMDTPTYYSPYVNTATVALALLIFALRPIVNMYNGNVNTYAFLPFGVLPKDVISMGDYLPIIPALGIFLIGMTIGRIFYVQRQTRFPGAPKWFRRIVLPFEFIGQHSLIVYLVHQPIILAILFFGRYAQIW